MKNIIVVIISANAEWKTTLGYYHPEAIQKSPYGDFFHTEIDNRSVIFFHGGWGKISAAATAQYVIDLYAPQIVINLGTCGGFSGSIEREQVILVDETIVYDIYESMTDAVEATNFYRTKLDLSWLSLPYPQQVKKSFLLSADRDIIPSEINTLKKKYAAVACDWESGAIAWVCSKNSIPCLILRGVTDLVDEQTGEAYGQIEVFEEGSRRVMNNLYRFLPAWLVQIG